MFYIPYWIVFWVFWWHCTFVICQTIHLNTVHCVWCTEFDTCEWIANVYPILSQVYICLPYQFVNKEESQISWRYSSSYCCNLMLLETCVDYSCWLKWILCSTFWAYLGGGCLILNVFVVKTQPPSCPWNMFTSSGAHAKKGNLKSSMLIYNIT